MNEKKNLLIVIISGLPGAGKTTLGQKIADALNLPFISKDDIKVRLFDVYGWKDREASKQAGSASFKIMEYFIENQIKCGNSLVVESTFNPVYDNARFRSWHKKYKVRIVQVYCYANDDVLRQRFAMRAKTDKRHVSSIEGEQGRQVLENYLQQGFKLLDITSTIIKVDTTDFLKIDEAKIIRQIQEANLCKNM